MFKLHATAARNCLVKNFCISSGRYKIRPDDILIRPDELLCRPDDIIIRPDKILIRPDEITEFVWTK